MIPNTNDGHVYRTVMQPPPGPIVAPNGFPADPHPAGAPRTFLDAMAIRLKVFCDEQGCAVGPELDDDDPRSWSWVVYRSVVGSTAPEEPVATVRIVPPPHPPHPNGFRDPDEEPYIKLTRVATVPGGRGKGLSRRLCEEAFKYLAENPELVGHRWKGMVLTHAQVAVEKMYARMNFFADDRLGRWDEEGIEHLGMWRRLEVKR